MKILLCISSIYNTVENYSDDDFKILCNELEKLAISYNCEKIFFSFCDNTDNKDILNYFIRKLSNSSENIVFGYQFLNDTYYRTFDDGAHLYECSKKEKIINYVNILQENGFEVKLCYLDENGLHSQKKLEL